MADTPHSSLETAEQLHPAKIGFGTSTPSTPVFDGQVYSRTDTSRRWIGVAEGSNYTITAGLPILRSGTPVGYLADYAGQFYYDTATNNFYIALSVSATNWYQLGTGVYAGSGGGGS